MKNGPIHFLMTDANNFILLQIENVENPRFAIHLRNLFSENSLFRKALYDCRNFNIVFISEMFRTRYSMTNSSFRCFEQTNLVYS